MKVIVNRYLPPGKHFAAINLFGVFLVKKGVPITRTLLNHESIHTAQMKEMGYLLFYLVYVIEWLVRTLMKGNAYYNLSFEREAYLNDHDFGYLKNRRHYAWLKYFRKKKIGSFINDKHNKWIITK